MEPAKISLDECNVGGGHDQVKPVHGVRRELVGTDVAPDDVMSNGGSMHVSERLPLGVGIRHLRPNSHAIAHAGAVALVVLRNNLPPIGQIGHVSSGRGGSQRRDGFANRGLGFHPPRPIPVISPHLIREYSHPHSRANSCSSKHHELHDQLTFSISTRNQISSSDLSTVQDLASVCTDLSSRF